MGRPKSIIVLNENFKNRAKQYYETLLRLGYNPKSCRSNYHYIEEFLHWLEQQGQLALCQIQAQDINAYYAYISTRPHKQKQGLLHPKTTHQHMKNISDFFEMLVTQQIILINPSSTLHFPYPREKAERTILTQSEIQQLYKVCQSGQERAILSLAYGCGLRVSELVKCNIADIRLSEKILIVPDGKGRKRRAVPMSDGIVKDLADYYYTERQDLTRGRDYKPKEKAFMLHSRGGRMQMWTYNHYLKRIIHRTERQVIKDKQITIHSLRHSIATHLLEQGIPVEQVRLFLGHSQLETTQYYTQISQTQLKQLMQ